MTFFFFLWNRGVIGRSEIPGSLCIRNTKGLIFFFNLKTWGRKVYNKHLRDNTFELRGLGKLGPG